MCELEKSTISNPYVTILHEGPCNLYSELYIKENNRAWLNQMNRNYEYRKYLNGKRPGYRIYHNSNHRPTAYYKPNLPAYIRMNYRNRPSHNYRQNVYSNPPPKYAPDYSPYYRPQGNRPNVNPQNAPKYPLNYNSNYILKLKKITQPIQFLVQNIFNSYIKHKNNRGVITNNNSNKDIIKIKSNANINITTSAVNIDNINYNRDLVDDLTQNRKYGL